MNELAFTILKIATATSSRLIGIDLTPLDSLRVGNDLNTSASEEITAEALHAYAKIEQELAIARRTLISETVEIEEYFGNSLKGDIGAKVGATDIGLGASAEGGKVTKRIIRFSGFNAHTESMLNAIEASMLLKLKTELSTSIESKAPVTSNIAPD